MKKFLSIALLTCSLFANAEVYDRILAVVNGEISLGIGVDWLESETGRSISRPGLKKYVDKNFRS